MALASSCLDRGENTGDGVVGGFEVVAAAPSSHIVHVPMALFSSMLDCGEKTACAVRICVRVCGRVGCGAVGVVECQR